MTTALIDYLKDMVQHTYGLGFIDLIKVSDVEGVTTINAIAEDRSVIIQAASKTPILEFATSTVGFPNLQKLSIVLGIPEYKEGASVKVAKTPKDGVDALTGLHFENKAGDFQNDYRFMSQEIINEKLRAVKFKGVTWDIEFVPNSNSIQRLKYMAQANSEEAVFTAKTKGGNLEFIFGDHSTHAGNFIFQDKVQGVLNKEWKWPVTAIISILSLPGDKMFKISDAGAAQITVDSGLVIYEYIIPAQQK